MSYSGNREGREGGRDRDRDRGGDRAPVDRSSGDRPTERVAAETAEA